MPAELHVQARLGECANYCDVTRLSRAGKVSSPPPSDNSNDRWKHLCLVSWAAAPCVWTL